MFGLKIQPPAYRILERLPGLFENSNRIGVWQSLEFRGDHAFECAPDFFIDPLTEEFHLIGALLERIAKEMFEEIFSDIHVVVEFSPSHFGLDHPKLGGVTAGVGILRSKRRTECVNFR